MKAIAVVLLLCFVIGATSIQNSPVITYPKSEYVTMQGVPVSYAGQTPYFGWRKIATRVQNADGSYILYVVS